MNSKWVPRLDRRDLLQTTYGLVAGSSGVAQAGSVTGQNATASVTFNDQQSSGESIVISSLETDTDARFYIGPITEENNTSPRKRLDLSAGTSFTDRTVQLDQPLEESGRVAAVIQAGENYGEVIADDTAFVAVDESLTASGYNTPAGVQKIDEDPAAGFHSPYFLYTPRTPEAAEKAVNNPKRPLLVKNYGWGDYEERIEGARKEVQGRMQTVADTTNSPLLAAPLWYRVASGFGLKPDAEISNPSRKRVDRQLIAMIEDAKSRLNGSTYTVGDKIHFRGASLGGRFIDRFAALHPEYVNVFSSGANGMAFLPVSEVTSDFPTHGNDTDEGKSLLWHVGTANFEKLVGEKFNKDEWMKITQYRWIGELDQDLENPEDYIHKAFKGSSEIAQLIKDVLGSFQVDHRFKTSQKIYNYLGVPATFTIFEGEGHVPGDEDYEIITDFHLQKVVENFDMAHIIPQKSASQISLGDTFTITVNAKNPAPVPTTTTVVFALDDTEIKSVEREIPADGVSEVTFTHTFENAGTYTPKINGQDIGDGVIKVTESTSDPENSVGISNIQINPSIVASTHTHTLTFDVTNLSTDGNADTFSIELPNSVEINKINNVKAEGITDPEIPEAENPITFNVNPNQSEKIGAVTITVELTLSSSDI